MRNYQDRVAAWVRDCFGDEVQDNVDERALRFLEEAVELVQSMGMNERTVNRITQHVYGRRHVGKPGDEIGGVMITLAALSEQQGLNMERCGELELNRVWRCIDEIRGKTDEKPDDVVAVRRTQN